MQKHIKSKHIDQMVTFAFAKYQADHSTAITLHDVNTGERLTTATVCLMDYAKRPRDEQHVFIKNWSENVGLTEALFTAGVLTPVLEYQIGDNGVPVFECKLSDEAFAERNRQMAERGEL